MSSFNEMEQSLKKLSGASANVPLDEVTLLRLIHHYSDFITVMLRQLVKPYNLTDWSMRALLMMRADADKKGVPMATLGNITGESATNMTRICDELVKSGLAIRSSDLQDRRKVLLSTTPKADAILAQVTPLVWGHLSSSMSELSKEEITLMIALLKKLTIGAENEAKLIKTSTP